MRVFCCSVIVALLLPTTPSIPAARLRPAPPATPHPTRRFVPPAGWKVLGVNGVPHLIATWYRDRKGSRDAIVISVYEPTPVSTIIASPAPATATAPRGGVQAQRRSSARASRSVRASYDPDAQELYVGTYRICGTKGYKRTFRVGGWKGYTEMLDVINLGRYRYQLMYVRGAKAMPDLHAVWIMDHFCPGTPSAVAARKPPVGWKGIRVPHIWQPLGMWSNGEQWMTLAVTTAAIPKSAAVAQRDAESLVPGSGYVTRANLAMLCDVPALTFTDAFTSQGFRYVEEIELTADSSQLYSVNYTRVAGEAERPEARVAMRSLCIDAEPTPLPTPIQTPQATPSPTSR